MKVSLVSGTKVAIGVEVKMGGIFDERDGGDASAVLKTRGEGFGESGLGGRFRVMRSWITGTRRFCSGGV